MDNLEGLLKEAFHTYQLYLLCTNILADNQAKLPLLKWPDIAQSALAYAKSLKHGESTEAVEQVLSNDLAIATTEPVAIIYRATRKRVEELLGKEPAIKAENGLDPIEHKNNMILALNELFSTLETMTGVKYPRLNKRLVMLSKGTY